MSGSLFEWDAEKAAENQRRHGVSFATAARAFLDSFAVERVDERMDYGEDRINLLGMVDGVVLNITYTERGHRLRIISARRAIRNEQGDYFRQNAP